MKTKKICAAVALLGCLLMISGWALAGFDFAGLFSDKSDYTEVVKTETIGADDTIEIKTDTEIVKITLSDDEQVHLKYSDSDKAKHLYSYDGGVLSLSIDYSNGKWYDSINFDFLPSERYIEMQVPPDFKGKLDVGGETGAINIENLTGLAQLDLTLTTGDLNISGCNATDARIVTTTGKLKASELGGDTLYVECTTGAISLDGLSESALTVRSITGSIALANATCDTIDARVTTGRIQLSDVDAKDIVLRSTTGSVTGNIACKATEFTIDTATTTGQNNLGNVHFGGERKLDIETTTGDINITFAE